MQTCVCRFAPVALDTWPVWERPGIYRGGTPLYRVRENHLYIPAWAGGSRLGKGDGQSFIKKHDSHPNHPGRTSPTRGENAVRNERADVKTVKSQKL